MDWGSLQLPLRSFGWEEPGAGAGEGLLPQVWHGRNNDREEWVVASVQACLGFLLETRWWKIFGFILASQLTLEKDRSQQRGKWLPHSRFYFNSSFLYCLENSAWCQSKSGKVTAPPGSRQNWLDIYQPRRLKQLPVWCALSPPPLSYPPFTARPLHKAIPGSGLTALLWIPESSLSAPLTLQLIVCLVTWLLVLSHTVIQLSTCLWTESSMRIWVNGGQELYHLYLCVPNVTWQLLHDYLFSE